MSELLSSIIHVRWFRVGGLGFVQVGRFQVSYCVVRRDPWAQ